MTSTYGMPELEKQVRKELEDAYNSLRMASQDMDIVDTVEAAKISKVRKEVLDLIHNLNL